MLDEFKILTITHKRINLKDIGAFSIDIMVGETTEEKLSNLKERFGLSELFYTATCNRVMFFFSNDFDVDQSFVEAFFQYINPLLSDEWIVRLPDVVQVYKGTDALRHFFNVASSIDSLVIGERQILGQLRTSFDQCTKAGLIGDYLKLAMNQAVLCAKSIYSNTQIGDKAVSVVSLATRKLLNTNMKKDSRIVVVGAGQTNQLVVKFLDKHGFNNVSVFNRTLSRAEQVAEIVGGRAFTLSDLYTYKEGFDCLVVCTASNKPIISTDLYGKLLGDDQDKKVIIDLAIPHNVEQAVIDQFATQYIEIEGLRSLANENLASREREVVHAQAILEEFLDAFPSLHNQRKLELAMRSIPAEIKAVKSKAMNIVFKKEMDDLDEDAKALVERMMAYMEKKCIGIPMKAAREMIIH